MTAEAAEAAAPRRWRHLLRVLLAVVFVAAVGGAVAVTLRGQDWSVLATLTTPRAAVLAVGALLANGTALLLTMVSWRELLTDLGAPTTLRDGARIFFVGFVAKFVPGRVWTLLANIHLGRAAGIAPAQMTATFVLSMVVSMLTGLTGGLIAAPVVLGVKALWLVPPCLLLVACVVRPDLVNQFARLLTRLLRRPAPASRASDRGLRRSITIQLTSWGVAGLHLWLLALAAGAPPVRSFAVCVGAFGLATVLGSVVIFVPDGVGVREVLLIGALTTVMPLPSASAVVLVSRLVCTLSELLCAGIALLSTLPSRRRSTADTAAREAAAVGGTS
jgi:glycosyltransferase 2 family protein